MRMNQKCRLCGQLRTKNHNKQCKRVIKCSLCGKRTTRKRPKRSLNEYCCDLCRVKAFMRRTRRKTQQELKTERFQGMKEQERRILNLEIPPVISHERCSYCLRNFGSLVTFKGERRILKKTREHTIPKVVGGTQTMLACQLCNRIKWCHLFECVADLRMFVLERYIKDGSMTQQEVDSLRRLERDLFDREQTKLFKKLTRLSPFINSDPIKITKTAEQELKLLRQDITDLPTEEPE
jgi:hypothetical protein